MKTIIKGDLVRLLSVTNVDKRNGFEVGDLVYAHEEARRGGSLIACYTHPVCKDSKMGAFFGTQLEIVEIDLRIFKEFEDKHLKAQKELASIKQLIINLENILR